MKLSQLNDAVGKAQVQADAFNMFNFTLVNEHGQAITNGLVNVDTHEIVLGTTPAEVDGEDKDEK